MDTYDVFISHSTKDAIIAKQLCDYLEGNGIKCWIAPRDVTAGVPYARAILQGIDESTIMVLVFSGNSNKSRHVESEVDRAFNKEKVIIPFRITDIKMSDVLSYYIGVNHYIDGIPEPTSAFENLKTQIEKNLPNRHEDSGLNEILFKLASMKGLSVDELKQAIGGLRKSENDSFEELLAEFQSQEQEKALLPNGIGVKGKYSILQNAKGEIMIMMDGFEGKPENQRFIYDGSGTALLYRNQESSTAFRQIDERAREALKRASEVLVVEIVGDDVEREYFAPIRFVKNVEDLIP